MVNHNYSLILSFEKKLLQTHAAKQHVVTVSYDINIKRRCSVKYID